MKMIDEPDGFDCKSRSHVWVEDRQQVIAVLLFSQ